MTEASLYSPEDLSLYSSCTLCEDYADASSYLYSSSSLYAGLYGEQRSGYSAPSLAPGVTVAPSASVAPASQATEFFAKYYWNSKYQSLRERPVFSAEDREVRAAEIRKLLDAFVEQSTPIVQTIVREVNLPVSKKTLRPIDAGGVAGGTKFMQEQFFFKFACDDEALSLYGGAHEAQKAATHELRSLNALLECQVTSLHFPLMSVFTYLGYRIICVSKLPIRKQTLIYGSADAGRTIFSDPTFHALFGECAKRLNLCEHEAQDFLGRRHKLWGPVDLEGHLADDGRMYCIDAARLFPPTLPIKGLPGSHLYRLFRPELVVRKGPLSSDVFTFFGMLGRRENNRAAKDAMTHLLLEVIPACAKSLTLKELQGGVKAAVHAHGINLRYLGVLLQHSQDAAVRGVILSEMVARAFKNELFARFRGATTGHEEVAQRFAAEFTYERGLLARYFVFCRAPKYNEEQAVQAVLDSCPQLDIPQCVARGLELAGVEVDSQGKVQDIRVLVKRLQVPDGPAKVNFEDMERFYELATKREGMQAVEALLNLGELYVQRPGALQKGIATLERALKTTQEARGTNSLEAAEVMLLLAEHVTALSIVRAAQLAEEALSLGLERAAWPAMCAAAALGHMERAKSLLVKLDQEDARVRHNALKLAYLSGEPVDASALTELRGKLSLASERALCMKTEAEVRMDQGEDVHSLLEQVASLEREWLGDQCWPLVETLSLQGKHDEALAMAKQLSGGAELDPRAAYAAYNADKSSHLLLVRRRGFAPPEGGDRVSFATMLKPAKDFSRLSFHIQALSPELKELLEASGVTQEDLMDAATVTLIFTTLLETFGGEDEEEDSDEDSDDQADALYIVDASDDDYEAEPLYVAEPLSEFYEASPLDETAILDLEDNAGENADDDDDLFGDISFKEEEEEIEVKEQSSLGDFSELQPSAVASAPPPPPPPSIGSGTPPARASGPSPPPPSKPTSAVSTPIRKPSLGSPSPKAQSARGGRGKAAPKRSKGKEREKKPTPVAPSSLYAVPQRDAPKKSTRRLSFVDKIRSYLPSRSRSKSPRSDAPSPRKPAPVAVSQGSSVGGLYSDDDEAPAMPSKMSTMLKEPSYAKKKGRKKSVNKRTEASASRRNELSVDELDSVSSFESPPVLQRQEEEYGDSLHQRLREASVSSKQAAAEKLRALLQKQRAGRKG